MIISGMAKTNKISLEIKPEFLTPEDQVVKMPTFDMAILFYGMLDNSIRLKRDCEFSDASYACTSTYGSRPNPTTPYMVKLPNQQILIEYKKYFGDKHNGASWLEESGSLKQDMLSDVESSSKTASFKHEASIAFILQRDAAETHPGRQHLIEVVHFTPNFYGIPMLLLADFNGLLSDIDLLQQQSQSNSSYAQNFDWFTIAQHVCLGLAYMHTMSIHHNNICRQAIAYRDDGTGRGFTFLITDFSQATHITDDARGTNDYEQAAGMAMEIATELNDSYQQYYWVLRNTGRPVNAEVESEVKRMSNNSVLNERITRQLAFKACYTMTQMPVRDANIDIVREVLLHLLHVPTESQGQHKLRQIQRALHEALSNVYDDFATHTALLSSASALAIATDAGLRESVWHLIGVLYNASSFMDLLRGNSAGHQLLENSKKLLFSLLKSNLLWVLIADQVAKRQHEGYINRNYKSVLNTVLSTLGISRDEHQQDWEGADSYQGDHGSARGEEF